MKIISRSSQHQRAEPAMNNENALPNSFKPEVKPRSISFYVLLGALIVGAALMMRINSSFQIFGYPGIAMICFLIATGGSGWLIIGILWKDYKDKRKRKE